MVCKNDHAGIGGSSCIAARVHGAESHSSSSLRGWGLVGALSHPMAFAWTHRLAAFFDHGLMFCATRERARLAAAGRHARLAIQEEEDRLRRLFPPLPAALVAGVFRQYTLRVMLYDIRNLFALATVSGSVFRIVVRNAWRYFPADFEFENPRRGEYSSAESEPESEASEEDEEWEQ